MQRIILALVLGLLVTATGFPQHRPVTKRPKPQAVRQNTPPAEPVQFALWERQEDLRKRTGVPQEYFVPAIQKLIHPEDLRYYSDNYRKVDDVFYRDTSAGRVRILVAYAKDESLSHLNPEILVEKLHFFFDKDVTLRKALAAITELRELCTGGCILNGFSSTVVAQPASPSEAQVALARKMKPHWRGQDMSDATPGAEVYFVDSPYPVDFEHSPVDRIDYTLTSNAGREHYTLTVANKAPTVLDVWRPRSSDAQAAVK